MKNFFVILFFNLLAIVQASSIEMEFCFSDPISMADVNKVLLPFFKTGEIIQATSKECFSVLVQNEREELITRLVRKEFPGGIKQILGERKSSTGRGCEFVLEELTAQQAKENELFFGSYINVNSKQIQNRASRTTSLLVSEGHKGTMTIGRFLVYIKCLKMSPTIEVSVSLESLEGGFSTSLTLRPGEKREIGHIVESLAGAKNEASIKNGIEWNQRDENKDKKYLLSVRPIKER